MKTTLIFLHFLFYCFWSKSDGVRLSLIHFSNVFLPLDLCCCFFVHCRTNKLDFKDKEDLVVFFPKNPKLNSF